MHPNPRIAPYFCLEIDLPLDPELAIVIKRCLELVRAFHRAREQTAINNVDLETLADSNAVVILTGQFFCDRIIEGKDGSLLWRAFSNGVQQFVSLYLSENKA